MMGAEISHIQIFMLMENDEEKENLNADVNVDVKKGNWRRWMM